MGVGAGPKLVRSGAVILCGPDTRAQGVADKGEGRLRGRREDEERCHRQGDDPSRAGCHGTMVVPPPASGGGTCRELNAHRGGQ
ncbi:MAG: hypothetical protein ACRDQZ_07645, partial [Mycobacteriales bacterium]